MYVIQILSMKFIIVNDKNIPLLIVNLISNFIVYITFGISILIEGLLIMGIKINNRIFNMLLIALIEITIIFIICKIKRLKYGLSFLKNKNNEYLNIIMINISAIVILVYYLYGNYYGNLTKQITICLILLAFVMFLLIQKTLTLYYKQKLLHQTSSRDFLR